MKAIVYRAYGGPEVLSYEEQPAPEPKDDQVLVRIRAASVNPYDWHFMRGSPFALRAMSGLARPKDPRFGVDAAGIVERVGAAVTQLKPGDAVFGGCRGALAEYACAAAASLAIKPENVTFEQAATIPIAGQTALQGLRNIGKIQRGHRVLVNGASGGVGTFAVQIAKSFGAEVTGVCSTRNVDLVRSIGADRVVDYTREDFTARGERYDIILDCYVNRPLRAYVRALTNAGSYVLVGGPGRGPLGPLGAALGAVAIKPFVKPHVATMLTKSAQADLALIGGLIAAGTITPVIDRRHPLRDSAEAIRYLEDGHPRGKVVIDVT
ncbi:MAG TPA: NAD(P)-dependent alcohol dehydrogenase [Vicinamibacterales bacterium]|nr:NAD(P)-dependent alcohol dehydrogenase [Vicinamibacterales bacterium]